MGGDEKVGLWDLGSWEPESQMWEVEERLYRKQCLHLYQPSLEVVGVADDNPAGG